LGILGTTGFGCRVLGFTIWTAFCTMVLIKLANNLGNMRVCFNVRRPRLGMFSASATVSANITLVIDMKYNRQAKGVLYRNFLYSIKLSTL
jgi:hypothetical protein